MNKKILFIHTISNTPYKHEYYNSLSKIYQIFVIQISDISIIRNWEPIKDKKYVEFVLNKKNIENRNRILSIIKLYKIIKNINPDLILSHGYYRIEFLIAPLIFKNKITICDVATTSNDKKRNIILEKMKSKCLHFIYNYFFTYGKLAKDYLSKNLNIYEDRIYLRGNASHLQLISPNKQIDFNNRKNEILFIGRLSEEKNIKTLINALLIYNLKKRSKFNLTIIGTGPLDKELEEYTRNKHGGDVVRFIGHLPPDNLITFYENSKVFVLPSYSEPWGQVINEALHFGLPVIVSENCGCVADLCQKENSRIFNPNKIEQLVNIFEDLLENNFELKKMSLHSLEVIKSYSPISLEKRSIEIFEEIFNKN
jgi:glycosyltransferase involved in cell wall biosynthesis